MCTFGTLPGQYLVYSYREPKVLHSVFCSPLCPILTVYIAGLVSFDPLYDVLGLLRTPGELTCLRLLRESP